MHLLVTNYKSECTFVQAYNSLSPSFSLPLFPPLSFSLLLSSPLPSLSLSPIPQNTSVTWWPGNDAVYMYAPNLREVFESIIPLLRRYDTAAPNLVADVKAYFQNTSAAASMLQAKGKTERKQLVEMITNYQLMRGLIRLFKLDPMLAFSSVQGVCTCVCATVWYIHVSCACIMHYCSSSA